MALMRATRKAEGEHEQEKHNTSSSSRSSVISEDQSHQDGSASHDPETPTQESWSKWVEMQEQLMAAVKRAQNVPKKPQQKGSTQGLRRNRHGTDPGSQRPQQKNAYHNDGAA